MITDPDRFQQDKSPYERPNFPYRCGRLSLWGKPCGRGPDGKGGCGGTSDCTPFLENDRWHCRRPAQSGGACENGPLPDGRCCNQHPPCRPIPTLRGYRARLTILAAALILALIGAFALNGDDARAVSSISPGELTSKHARFTSEKGCATCHAPDGADAAGWIRAAWSPNAMTQSCGSCHRFDGPATAPHNEIFGKDRERRRTECVMCHTEHKGADANITSLADPQCGACHQEKFASFSNGHPAFSKKYPARRRTAIAFNHNSHLDKYFLYPQYADRPKKERCIGCHDTGAASRNVPVRSFKQACAACHEKQIPKRALVVFNAPEFEKNPFDAEAVGEACGPLAETPDSQDAYESASGETVPAPAAMLLGLEDGEDIDAYSEPVRDMIMGMIEAGVEPLVAGIEGRPGADMLFAGLSPDLLRLAGCAWAANQEYVAPDGAGAGGWFADEFSLQYRPPRHGDPVAKAWLDLAAASGDGVGDELRDDTLSQTKGVGACAKCHSVSAVEGGQAPLRIEWKYGAKSDRRHVRYSHGPHLNLLGLGKSCENCHKIDDAAGYDAAFKQFNPLEFTSNFKAMGKSTCTACHAEKQVRQNCGLCHQYHNGGGFLHRMTAAGSTKLVK